MVPCVGTVSCHFGESWGLDGIPPETDAKCDPTPPETYFSAEERVPEKMRRSDSEQKVEGGGRSTRKALGFLGILLFRPDWLNLDWYRFLASSVRTVRSVTHVALPRF